MAVTREELVAKWVEKLRDPGAKQGRSILRSQTGERCALGFLCDAAEDLGLGSWRQVDGSWLFVDETGDEGHFNYPNCTVCRFFDTSRWPGITVSQGGTVRDVSHLNDSQSLSLAEIADLVEAEYL